MVIALISSVNVLDNASLNTFEKRKILASQIEGYLIEYNELNSQNSAWLAFQVINSDIDEDILLDALLDIKNNSDDLSPLINCLLENNKTNALDLSFVLCLDVPSIYISYFYYNNESDIQNFFPLLEKHEYSDKEQSHISYLLNNTIDNYILPDPSSIDFLDFYYFDNIFDAEDNIDYFDYHLNSNITNFNSVNSDRIVLLLNLINGLFRSEREYDVFIISQQISDYIDLPISTLSMRIFRYISFSSYFSGYYQYDIDLYRGSIIPLSQFFGLEEEMKARLDFGVSLFQIGNLSLSLNELERVFRNIDVFEDFRYQSATLNNLGIVYYYIGYFEDYLQLIITGLDLASRIENIELKVDLLYNLHIYHKKIENWSVALDYLNQVSEVVDETGDKRRLALVYQSYATFYRDSQNDLNKSLEYLLIAENYARDAQYYTLLSSILAELIDTYTTVGDYYNALIYTRIMKDDAIVRDDYTYELYSYVNLANLYFEMDNFKTASYYIDIIKSRDLTQLRFSKFQTLLTKALARYEILINNNNTKAVEILNTFADDLILRIKNSSDIQSGHLMFEKEYLSFFQLLISQLIEKKDRESALLLKDEIKNLSSANFFNNPALKSSILSESELVLDFALRNRIERLRSQLRTASEDKRVQLNTLLFEAISEQNALRRKVLQHVDMEPIDLRKLRRLLGRSDIILYFSIFNDDLYVSTISSGSFNMHHLIISDEDNERIQEIVNSLSGDRVRLTELAWLNEKIFSTIDISEHFTNYFIIPDGFLYHIPFEILPVGDVTSDYSYGEATYLIERAAVSYSNSLRDLKSSLNHRPKRSFDFDFVGFGITHFDNAESQMLPGRYLPALPLAEREVEEIATNLNSFNRNYFLNSETSTESRLRQKAGNNRILHFATHSEVYESDPLYSVIYLNPDPEYQINGNPSYDGLVYAYELFQLDLSSEMVMLNSCESGSGNYIQGSGIVGFSRAFNYAGIPSLVMNLWTVRDRSAYHLSVSFYDYLNQGYSKNEAMRKAKIDYMNEYNSNPTHWGSFVVYGNIDPIVPSKSRWVFAVVVLIIGGISLIIALLRLPGKIRSRLK